MRTSGRISTSPASASALYAEFGLSSQATSMRHGNSRVSPHDAGEICANELLSNVSKEISPVQLKVMYQFLLRLTLLTQVHVGGQWERLI